MSAETLFSDLMSLDDREKGRFLDLLEEWDFSRIDAENAMKRLDQISRNSKIWYTAKDLDELIESTPDDEK